MRLESLWACNEIEILKVTVNSKNFRPMESRSTRSAKRTPRKTYSSVSPAYFPGPFISRCTPLSLAASRSAVSLNGSNRPVPHCAGRTRLLSFACQLVRMLLGFTLTRACFRRNFHGQHWLGNSGIMWSEFNLLYPNPTSSRVAFRASDQKDK